MIIKKAIRSQAVYGRKAGMIIIVLQSSEIKLGSWDQDALLGTRARWGAAFCLFQSHCVKIFISSDHRDDVYAYNWQLHSQCLFMPIVLCPF